MIGVFKDFLRLLVGAIVIIAGLGGSFLLGGWLVTFFQIPNIPSGMLGMIVLALIGFCVFVSVAVFLWAAYLIGEEFL